MRYLPFLARDVHQLEHAVLGNGYRHFVSESRRVAPRPPNDLQRAFVANAVAKLPRRLPRTQEPTPIPGAADLIDLHQLRSPRDF